MKTCDHRRKTDVEERTTSRERRLMNNGFYSCSLPSPRPRPSHRLRDDSLLLSSFGTFVSYSSTKCFSPAFPIPCPGRYTVIMQRMETVLEWLCFHDWPGWPTSRQAADTVAFVLICRHRANARAQLRCISDFSLDALQRDQRNGALRRLAFCQCKQGHNEKLTDFYVHETNSRWCGLV